MKRFIWISVIVLALLLAFILVGRKAGWIGDSRAIKVAVTKPEKRTIVEKVIASGKIYPTREVKISSDVAGEIIELYIREGDSVHAGMELARIKPDIYMADVDRALASVNTAKANLLTAKSSLTQIGAQRENAEKQYQRNKTLVDQKVISPAEFEPIETQYRSLQAQYSGAVQSVEAARFNVQSAQANLKQARSNLSRTSIIAPISGVVSRVGVERGERVVGTYQMSGTEMFRIADLYEMEARVDISENDVLRVTVGDTAEVDVAAYPNKKFYGIVTEIAKSANTTAGLAGVTTDQVTNFTVRIAINKDDYSGLINTQEKRYPLLPGMSAQVEIRTRRAGDVISVPIQAVTTRTDTANTSADKLQEIVFVVKGGEAHATAVTTGIQDDRYIEIKSGIETSNEIVEAPYAAVSRLLEDGSKVQVVEKEKLFNEKGND